MAQVRVGRQAAGRENPPHVQVLRKVVPKGQRKKARWTLLLCRVGISHVTWILKGRGHPHG